MATGSPPVAYLDSSALVKLIAQEPETAALRRELARWPRRVSSMLAATELTRTARRLATAASISAELGVLITYDRRMLAEAQTLALPVLSPP